MNQSRCPISLRNHVKRGQNQLLNILMLTRFGGKSTPLWGIFNNYKEKLRVPTVQTAVLIES